MTYTESKSTKADLSVDLQTPSVPWQLLESWRLGHLFPASFVPPPEYPPKVATYPGTDGKRQTLPRQAAGNHNKSISLH